MGKRGRDHIINLYSKTIEALNGSIRQTVVSIWSATVLYIAIFWSFTSFSYNQKDPFCPILSIIILVVSLLLAYLFVIFIFTQFSGWTSANRVGRVAFVSPHPESPGWPTEGARMYQPTTDQIRDRRANLRRPAKRAAGKRQWRAEATKEVSF